MKKNLLIALCFICAAATFKAGKADAYEYAAEITSASAPVAAVLCALDQKKDMNKMDCAGISFIATGASVTTFVLRDVQVVQTDALDYMAGAQATPALRSVVATIQEISLKEFGREIGFEETVNEIAQTL